MKIHMDAMTITVTQRFVDKRRLKPIDTYAVLALSNTASSIAHLYYHNNNFVIIIIIIIIAAAVDVILIMIKKRRNVHIFPQPHSYCRCCNSYGKTPRQTQQQTQERHIGHDRAKVKVPLTHPSPVVL